jgi:hypothetical protein
LSLTLPIASGHQERGGISVRESEIDFPIPDQNPSSLRSDTFTGFQRASANSGTLLAQLMYIVY